MKKKLRIMLSILFVLVIFVSLIVIVIDFKNANENEIIDDSPSEIITKEEDKSEIKVDSEQTIKISPDVNFALERINYNNNDIIARIEIPNLFNVLVVKGTNNEYYLNHSIYKKSDIKGSEFIDYRLEPTSKQVNIYGHNTRDKSLNVPFLRLESFLDEKFFEDNQYIIFQYENGKSIYQIMSIKEITTDYEHMNFSTTGQEFVKHVDRLAKDSIYIRNVEYDETSEIIVLQTCSHHLDDAYYIIVGIKMDSNIF